MTKTTGLVLTRAKDEKIIIGEGENQITIMVVEFRPGKVRLLIDAPRNIPVHRLEVWEAIQREKLPVAEASCDGKGLSGADYEHKRYVQGQDDQSLLHKMSEEQTEEN